jgi:hypothetical protein
VFFWITILISPFEAILEFSYVISFYLSAWNPKHLLKVVPISSVILGTEVQKYLINKRPALLPFLLDDNCFPFLTQGLTT